MDGKTDVLEHLLVLIASDAPCPIDEGLFQAAGLFSGQTEGFADVTNAQCNIIGIGI